MKRQAKVISVINWKGGVGKTTITHHLAAGLQHISADELEGFLGHRSLPKVLLVDADAQCNLSISCLTPGRFAEMVYDSPTPIGTLKELFEQFLPNEQPTINVEQYILKACVQSGNGEVYDHIDLLPSHEDLIYTDMNIAVYSRPNFDQKLIGADIYKFQILNNILNSVKNQYDFILIDCPPNLNYVTQNALYASDFYLIPTIPDRLSSYGLSSITHKVRSLNDSFRSAAKMYKETKLIGIVLNQIREYGGKPKDTQDNIISTLKELFPTDIFEHYLTYGDGISRASAHSCPVFAFPHANYTKQINGVINITREFLNKLADGVVV